MATQNQERKRMFVGGGLHGLELPVGMTKTTTVSYRLPDDFPSDALRMDEYRTLKLTLKTSAGTKHRRFACHVMSSVLKRCG